MWVNSQLCNINDSYLYVIDMYVLPPYFVVEVEAICSKQWISVK